MLVSEDEQIKRLNAARFQLDVMRVPGIIVARTDAEAANLLDGRGDERDQPFILGATNVDVPTYKAAFLAILRRFHDAGVEELNGHLLYALVATRSTPPPTPGSSAPGIAALVAEAAGDAWTRGRAAPRSTPCSTGSSRASSTPGRPRPASRPTARRWPT